MHSDKRSWDTYLHYKWYIMLYHIKEYSFWNPVLVDNFAILTFYPTTSSCSIMFWMWLNILQFYWVDFISIEEKNTIKPVVGDVRDVVFLQMKKKKTH